MGAILLAIALGGISRARLKTRDDIRVSDIQNIRLALEQYRSSCGVFPETLSLDASNGRRSDCAFTFGDFISEIPTGPSLSSGTEYEYIALTSSSTGGPCYEYHLAVVLEQGADDGYLNVGLLEEDHDYDPRETDSTYSYNCAGAGGFINVNNDMSGYYDFRSSNTQGL